MVFDFGSRGFLGGPDLSPIRLGMWFWLSPGNESGEGARLTTDVLFIVSSCARFLVPHPHLQGKFSRM